MRLAMMQPYFFPYIGYFQLLHAADVFVVMDQVQYINRGWIARNRIAAPGTAQGWRYLTVPVAAHHRAVRIADVRLAAPGEWRSAVLNALTIYRRAPFFAESLALIQALLADCESEHIAALDTHLLRGLAAACGLPCRVVVQSTLGIDYAGVKAPCDWALETAASLGAKTYINPVGGAALYPAAAFDDRSVALHFLRPLPPPLHSPVPDLSIIDVLMTHGVAAMPKLLARYDLLVPGEVEAR